MKLKNEPLVSIITPLYNSEKFIAETIESVLTQTYKNWEMIIVNDCSKDQGPVIVQKYLKKDSRIKLFNNEKNLGGAGTRNEAIKRATGKYIAFLDSDDLWKKEKLEKQINFMENNNYDLTYSKFERIDEESKSLYQEITIPEKVSYKQLFKADVIGCLTAIYNQEKLGKIYMPDVKMGQDFALWLKILKKINFAYGLDESLALYRIRKGSLSKNKFNRIKYNWIIFRKYNNQGVISSIWYLFNNIVDKVFELRVKKVKEDV